MQYDFVILYTIFYESVFPKYVITIEPPELLVLLFVSLLVTFDDSSLKVTLVAINDDPPPAPPPAAIISTFPEFMFATSIVVVPTAKAE